MISGLIMNEQECTGDYDFSLPACMTEGFLDTFGDCARELVKYCIMKINEIDKPDYLQVFLYKNVKFFCVSPVGRKESIRLPLEEQHITFMLATE